ncbi:MAG: hypothetical protein C5B50_05590 [Verrucomicrobia bacterium]|nr:MAG: hypothetical protein C5B50_05590 [Verrucomicrobiota bacterium]
MKRESAQVGSIIKERKPSLAIFDASHGQPNWSQTGFTSREMHTNYAGLMELLCRMGCRCAPVSQPLSQARLTDARLLVIPPPTGAYNAAKECWSPLAESSFASEHIRDILNFVRSGGRLLAFAYRFGDWFTRSNLRELVSPLGCLLNDDAVIDLQTLRTMNPLEAFFDTPRNLLPLHWSNLHVSSVRWRTTATFNILPGAEAQPLALSAGGTCISFNRSARRISFASLPIAVAGLHGGGRFVLIGGPHAFETGRFGLLTRPDNARFMMNVLAWLLDNGSPDLRPEPVVHHSSGTFFFERGLAASSAENSDHAQHTVAYVERLLRRTGVLKALGRPKWMP